MKNCSKCIALAAAVLLSCTGPVYAVEYPDVSEEDTAFSVAVLDAVGVINGFPDGTYRPGETLTRAQFCKIAVTMMGMENVLPKDSRKTLFSDVTSSHWAMTYINIAYENGLIEGYGNGKFGPDDTVTFAQAVTILLRMLDYSGADIGTHYPDDQLFAAESFGLTDNVSYEADEPVTRGDTAILFTNLLETETRSGNLYYQSVMPRSVSGAVLLETDAVSPNGKSGCVKLYANGQTSWYPQAAGAESSLIGAEGTALLSENGDFLAFLPDGTEYVLRDGILLTNSRRSGNDALPYEVVMYFPNSGTTASYLRTDTIADNLVGASGTLMTDENGYAAAFLSNGTDTWNVTSGAVLIRIDEDDGSAVFYTGGKETAYDLAWDSDVSESQVGDIGTILADKEGRLLAFVTDEAEYRIEEAILVSTSGGEAEFLIDGVLETLKTDVSLSSSQVGSIGTILLEDSRTAAAFLGAESYASVVTDAVLLIEKGVSDQGVRNSALFYCGGKAVWYERGDSMRGMYAGDSGVLLYDKDNVILAFCPDGEEYTVEQGVLLETDSKRVSFYVDGEMEEYRLDGDLSAGAVGSTGVILLNERGRVKAFVEYSDSDEKYTLTQTGILLDASITASDRRTETAKLYAGGTIMTYRSDGIDTAWEGSCGRLLCDSNGCATVFIEGDTSFDRISTDEVESEYRMKSTVPVVYYDEDEEEWCKSTWEQYQDMPGKADRVSVYFDELGDITVVIAR